MNKISAPSQVFGRIINEYETCKVFPNVKCQQGDEIFFRSTTKSAMEDDESEYAGKFSMASFYKKTLWTLCAITKKHGVKKIKICNCFCKYTFEDNQAA